MEYACLDTVSVRVLDCSICGPGAGRCQATHTFISEFAYEDRLLPRRRSGRDRPLDEIRLHQFLQRIFDPGHLFIRHQRNTAHTDPLNPLAILRR